MLIHFFSSVPLSFASFYTHIFHYLFQSNVIQGESHEVINRLVLQFREQLTPPLAKHLRKLRIKVERVLGGEDNVQIIIYISDVLDEPVRFQIGNGGNQVVFNIEEDGIDYIWTRRTL